MKKVLAIWILILTSSSLAHASGASKPVLVGPKAIGMGGAFVGIADDPTAIFHNPAGMTQLQGHVVELGFDSLITQEDYTPDQTEHPGAPKESADQQFLPVPQFAVVSEIAKPIFLGLGVFFPHGNGGKFSTPSASAGNPNEGKIYSMEITPAIAMEVIKGLSLGGTLRIARVSTMLRGQQTGIGTVDNLEASGWGIGGSVGALYKPCKFFSLGANYRTKIDVGVSGSATITPGGTFAESHHQPLPTLVTAGVGIAPIENLTLGLSYDFENNSELKQYDVTLQGIPGTTTFPQNWRDSHTFHFGGEYHLFPVIALRAGYARDFNRSIPDASMNRIIGDIDAHEVSAGASMKWNRYTFSLTWNGRFGSRTIPGPESTNPAAGKYEAFVNMISMGVEAQL